MQNISLVMGVELAYTRVLKGFEKCNFFYAIWNGFHSIIVKHFHGKMVANIQNFTELPETFIRINGDYTKSCTKSLSHTVLSIYNNWILC